MLEFDLLEHSKRGNIDSPLAQHNRYLARLWVI